MHNFEDADPCDKQHGFCPMYSSINAAFLKLLTFESTHMQRATICTVQHDMSAHFDRMYPVMTSIYASCYKVDKNTMLLIGKTIRHLQQNVETSLGISDKSYRQLGMHPKLEVWSKVKQMSHNYPLYRVTRCWKPIKHWQWDFIFPTQQTHVQSRTIVLALLMTWTTPIHVIWHSR